MKFWNVKMNLPNFYLAALKYHEKLKPWKIDRFQFFITRQLIARRQWKFSFIFAVKFTRKYSSFSQVAMEIHVIEFRHGIEQRLLLYSLFHRCNFAFATRYRVIISHSQSESGLRYARVYTRGKDLRERNILRSWNFLDVCKRSKCASNLNTERLIT